MKRLLITLVSTCLLILLFPQDRKTVAWDYMAVYKNAGKMARIADRLADKADVNERAQQQQEKLYAEALAQYELAERGASAAGNDSLRFHIYVQMGLIDHYFDSIGLAKQNYTKAIALKPSLRNIDDTFLFKPCLFLGGILYDAHDYDSASYYFQRAETIQSHSPVPLEESQRLYNKLGAMNYETGNYQLSERYFEKALSSLKTSQASYASLMINYKINIASILVKLQEFERARVLYDSILPFNIYQDQIWHNLGIICNRQSRFKEAIEDFKKVNYPQGSKNVELDYNIALAFDGLDQIDSAKTYLEKAARENSLYNNGQKNTPYGLIQKFLGDKAVRERRYSDALQYYQAAMIQFDISFDDTAVRSNPTTFTGIFSYINLFGTLTAKASVFRTIYSQSKAKKDLEDALSAYRSAFKLVDYVDKTYESDEARLFLNQIKYSEHGKPIDVCLELYQRTSDKRYLEEAYSFDQRNKASILSFNLQVRQSLNDAGELARLVHQKNIYRADITRLSLRAVQVQDKNGESQLNQQIGDLELKLASVQRTLEKNEKYAQLQPSDQVPSVSALQKKILDNNTALISYHLADTELVSFVITSRKFDYSRQVIGPDFYAAVQNYLDYLHHVSATADGKPSGDPNYLYAVLIKPVLPIVNAYKRLVVIPDDELSYLPFDALKDEDNHYLVEKFAIQYQYSTAMLNAPVRSDLSASGSVLAFAPFTGAGSLSGFQPLPYSEQEVKGLNGQVFTGADATKQNFLRFASHSPVIHLATHASVNDSVPLQSFISFYPSATDSAYRLYAQEIYDLHLDSTRLVILSACETGSGRLVKGEGLMSLSRAFSYAGCPNIITSLWQAEDKTTAFLTTRLHFYLQKNYSNDEALQKAKLDLLASDDIDPRFKTPNYWSHLVFIGSYSPGRSFSYAWWIAGLVLVLVLLAIVIKRRVPRKAGPSSS